jgi:hypothetical protein
MENEPIPPPQVPVEYPRTPVCPRCGHALEDGWCQHCSARRQRIWGWALVISGPIVGCGACVASGALSGMLFLGPLLACVTPVVGIFLIGTSPARRRP